MKQRKIKLNSRYLKPGDKIIRTKPLIRFGRSDDYSHTETALTVVKVCKHHTQIEDNHYILHDKWEDGNWIRVS